MDRTVNQTGGDARKFTMLSCCRRHRPTCNVPLETLSFSDAYFSNNANSSIS